MTDILTDLDKKIAKLPKPQAAFLRHQLDWMSTARLAQVPPSHEDQVKWLLRVNEDAPPDQPIAACLDQDTPWSEFGVRSGRGFGKGLRLQTLIPTPSGWTTMGALKAGDEVFDEQGRPCRVTDAYEPYTPEHLYRVGFSDGTSLYADGEHLWMTLVHRDRKQMTRHGIKRLPKDWCGFEFPVNGSGGSAGAQVRNTEDIRATFTHGAREDLNHCIPVTQPLDLPDLHLPIDPWLLGYWLGNGHAKGGTITIGSYQGDFDDTFIAPKLPEGTNVRRIPEKGHSLATPPGLHAALSAQGLLGNKHVPVRYLRASAAQRLALLQGLCDSDGHAAGKNVEFCSTDKALADAVFELATSLGEKPNYNEGRAKLYGKDCGPKYRIHWRGKINPFSLPRKRDLMAPLGGQSFRHDHRMITSITEVPAETVRCIAVDSPYAMYLAGPGMIPTHNSRLGAEWLARAAWEDPKGLPRCVIAPTQADVRFTCFEGESGLMSIIPPECVKAYNRSELLITLQNDATIRGFSAEKADRLRGPQHADGLLDEVAAWPGDAEETFDMFFFGLRLGDHPRFVWTSTPKPTQFIRKLTAPKPGRIIVRGSTYDNKANLAKSFISKLSEYEGTRLGRQEIHGEMIDPEEAGIVRRSQFRIWPHNHPLPKFEWLIMSLDTAFTERTLDKKGDPDPTACAVFGVFTHEKRTNVMVLDYWEDHLGLPDLVRRVKKEMAYSYGDDDDRALIQPLIGSAKPRGSGRKPDILLIEDKGSGISLRQTLAEMGIEAHPFNPGRADKLARLHIVSPIFAQKRVWVPESMDPTLKGRPRKWAEPLIDQLCTFAGEGSLKHDDAVDVATQALRFAVDNRLLEFSAEPQHKRRDREEEEFYAKGAQEAAGGYQNPYSM